MGISGNGKHAWPFLDCRMFVRSGLNGMDGALAYPAALA